MCVLLWEVPAVGDTHICSPNLCRTACLPPRLDAPQQVVIRETKHSEGSMAELAAAGAPTSVAGYEDADAATAVFGAIAPQCLRKFELHELALPPDAPAVVAA